MGEAKWKADYGEPWKTVPSQSSARLALIEERHGLQSRFLIVDDMANRIVACVNALSGITNIEGLGALTKALDVLIEAGTIDTGTNQYLHGREAFIAAVDAVARAYRDLRGVALDALYAPQASEAKPL